MAEPRIVEVGLPFTLSATPYTTNVTAYQWYRDSLAIPGATASTYTATMTTSHPEQATYYCMLTNACGNTQSRTFQVAKAACTPTMVIALTGYSETELLRFRPDPGITNCEYAYPTVSREGVCESLFAAFTSNSIAVNISNARAPKARRVKTSRANFTVFTNTNLVLNQSINAAGWTSAPSTVTLSGPVSYTASAAFNTPVSRTDLLTPGNYSLTVTFQSGSAGCSWACAPCGPTCLGNCYLLAQPTSTMLSAVFQPLSNCGIPTAGVCCLPQSTPGCSDADCCNQICAADPFCCSTSWDQDCANAAAITCCDSAIVVPTQFPTIQAAIDAVPSGVAKVISVLPGTYNQAFALNGKNVVVRGAPNNATILDGTGLTEAICRFTGGEPATAGVEGLVFRNGTVGSQIYPKAPFRVGGAIYGANSSASIRNCVFQSNTSDFGGGAYIYRSEIVVEGCQFIGNTGRNMGGGLMFFQSSGTVSGCGFTGNVAAQFGAGSGSAFKAVGAKTPGGTVALTNCSIQGGIGGDGASAVEMFGDETGVPGVMRISNCQISGNSSGGASTNGGGLRVVGPASCCVLTGGTAICGNTPRNVSGPFLIEGTATVCDCLADVTLDRFVNGADLGVVLAAWGAATANGAGDVNHDGAVNGTDLAMVLAAWGACQ